MLSFPSFGPKSQSTSKPVQDLATGVPLDNASARFKAMLCLIWHQGFNPGLLRAGALLKVKGKPQCFIVTDFVGMVFSL